MNRRGTETPRKKAIGLALASLCLCVSVVNSFAAERPAIGVRYLRGHEVAAMIFGDAAEKIAPFITDWFGPTREKAKTADLPDPHATPFESGALLLTPLTNTDPKVAGLTAAHQLSHASFLSFRPWIE